jgi:hypothetical protein
MAKREKKINFTYFLEKRNKAASVDIDYWPLYVRITFDRKNNQTPMPMGTSNDLGFMSEEEFERTNFGLVFAEEERVIELIIREQYEEQAENFSMVGIGRVIHAHFNGIDPYVFRGTATIIRMAMEKEDLYYSDHLTTDFEVLKKWGKHNETMEGGYFFPRICAAIHYQTYMLFRLTNPSRPKPLDIKVGYRIYHWKWGELREDFVRFLGRLYDKGERARIFRRIRDFAAEDKCPPWYLNISEESYKDYLIEEDFANLIDVNIGERIDEELSNP